MLGDRCAGIGASGYGRLAKPLFEGPLDTLGLLRSRATVRSIFLVALFGLSLAIGDAAAQNTTIDWSSFEVCNQCELDLSPFGRLGDSTGPGVIGGQATRVVSDSRGGFVVFDRGDDRGVLLFGPDASYRRTIGRPGAGPGEFRLIGEVRASANGTLLILDFERRAIISYTGDGDFLEEVPTRDQPLGPLQLMLGDSLGIVAAHDRRPALVGLPLHVLDVRTGELVHHFGQRPGGRWIQGGSFSDILLLNEASRVRNDRFWLGQAARPHLEEWSINGQRTRQIVGVLDWFDPPGRGRSPRVPTLITDFAVDRHERVWLLTQVLDPRWREVTPQGPEGAIPEEEVDRYLDARLDVFDLTGRRHLGTQVWDAPGSVALFERIGEVSVSVVESTTSEMGLQVVLYSLEQANQHYWR